MELLNVFLEAKSVSDLHEFLCKKKKTKQISSIQKSHPNSKFIKFRLLKSNKVELLLIQYYYELWQYFVTNLPAKLSSGFYSGFDELFKIAREIHFNFKM